MATKRGAKRPALVDDPADSALGSKRVMDAPSFDVRRAESSRRHLMGKANPPDVRRAESARQHVRALNAQFASWVQSQLQGHQDELWEDGVKDYLSHASHIMEKFKDIVDWLNSNAGNSATTSVAGTPDSRKALSENNDSILHPSITNGLSKEHIAPILASSQTSIANGFSKHTAPNLASSQTSVTNVFSFSKEPTAPSHASSQTSMTSAFSKEPTAPSLGSSRTSMTNVFSKEHTAPSLASSQTSMNNVFSFSKELTAPSLASSHTSKTNVFSKEHTAPSLASSQNSGFFPSSQSSGIFSFSQAPLYTGSQSSIPPKFEASDDVDEDQEQPSSPSVKKTEEKGIIVVHETKCKVYVKPDNPDDKGWKDMGMGLLSIKCKEGIGKATKESKPTIVIRNDVGKILLNALIYPGIKTNTQKNTITAIFHTSGGTQTNGIEAGKTNGAVARTYLLRMKTEEDAKNLASAIKEYAPSS